MLNLVLENDNLIARAYAFASLKHKEQKYGKKPYIIPIPGSRKVSRIKENFEAGNIMITPDEIRSLDEKLEGMNIPVFGGHSGS